MWAGQRENGSEILDNDPFWSQLKQSALEAKGDPLVWLQQDHIYGALASNSYVRTEFINWFEQVWDVGIEQTLVTNLKGPKR